MNTASSNILNNIDMSNTSIFISFIVFIIITFVSKYIIDKQTEDDDEKGVFNIIASISIGAFSSLLSLYTYKYLNRDSNDILTEPFYSKLNIV